MVKSTREALAVPRSEVRDILTEVLRKGAQEMLTTAIEAEVEEYIQEFAELRDENGRRSGADESSPDRLRTVREPPGRTLR